MAAGLRLYRKSTLPPALSWPPRPPQEQDVQSLEGSSKKARGKKLREKHLRSDEERQEATGQILLEQGPSKPPEACDVEQRPAPYMDGPLEARRLGRTALPAPTSPVNGLPGSTSPHPLQGLGRKTTSLPSRCHRAHRPPEEVPPKRWALRKESQRYLEFHKDLHRLRDALYAKYMRLLQEKVKKQRAQIQTRDDRFQHRLETRRRKKPKPGALPEPPSQAPPQARRPRPPPRSGIYLIVGLQEELARCGMLKHTSDYEHFWRLVQEDVHGPELKGKLQKVKFKLSNPRPPPLVAARRESRLLVETEQERPCQQRPARASSVELVPCLPQAQEAQQPPAMGLLSRLTEWRKKCQGQETMGQVARGLRRNQINYKMDQKDSRSKMYLSRLYQMYSTSIANMEFSRRLLERDGRFADVHAGRRAGGLLDYLVPEGIQQQEAAQPREAQAREAGAEGPAPPGRRHPAPPALNFLKCQGPAGAQRAFHPRAGQQVAPQARRSLPGLLRAAPAPLRVALPSTTAAPLTLEHVILTHPVVEVKRAGHRYWTNYVDKD